jgi:hypothetical protein
MKLQIQFHLARTNAEWPSRDSVIAAAGTSGSTHPGNRSLYGRTVGLLVRPAESQHLIVARVDSLGCIGLWTYRKGDGEVVQGFQLYDHRC